MKRIPLLVVVAIALSSPLSAHALNKKLTNKSYMDARQCLNLATDTAIIKCAERFM